MDPETVLGQIEALCALPRKRSSTADKVLAIIWGVSIEPAMRYDYRPDDPPATKLERIEQICSNYPSAGKSRTAEEVMAIIRGEDPYDAAWIAKLPRALRHLP
ncbi:hypothetical protein BKG82_28380 [Mycobacteroides chelonae]|uniref:Uncharacterized protein n=1 Tax=Mycobacteroides chelonae TaxID=1774 RepID=A0A1S1LH16_MYCCH|nr:hypothetical protein [Mycobacteroides chelonae]OHU46102.1 hypothetical protein BKG82_28380 [Mycobacteroides chelonae]